MRQFTTAIDYYKKSSMLAINNRIKGLISNGHYNLTLELYKDEIHPAADLIAKTFSLPSVIKACSSSQAHHFGLQLHCVAIKTGFVSDAIISNSLIAMYSKFRIPEDARQVFDTMPHRDAITWNSMINCYVHNGYLTEGLHIFKKMYVAGFVTKPELTASITSMCGQNMYLRLGKQIHAQVVVDGSFKESAFLSSVFVDLYFKCDDPLMAFRTFNQTEAQNEVSWTAMISGCIFNRNYNMAIDFFQSMQLKGFKTNRVTLTCILPAFTELGNIAHAKEIHGYAFRHGFVSDHHFSAALINMYGKLGDGLRFSILIFERSIVKDVVLWSSIISSCCQSKDEAKAMELFGRMQVEGTKPNYVTLLAVIGGCISLSSLHVGAGVHCYILKYGLNSNVFVNNALINMYAKCGSLNALNQIFKEMPVRDSVSWSTLISSYGLHGHGEDALQQFNQMKEQHGIEADEITYLAVLSACKHSGLVEEAQEIFGRAIRDGKIKLSVEHYACYIDLLGKLGRLEDACEIVRQMPVKPSTRIWSSLMSACKDHGRLEIAEMLALELIRIEPDNVANYTLLSMVYAETRNWVKVEEVRRMMRVKGLKKCYGFSQIELEKG